MKIQIPDSKLCREITEFIKDETTSLLFNHSSRVYCFACAHGLKHEMKFDRELLYAGAMFHDLGLMPQHASPNERFEVDGANGAKAFLKARGIAASDLDTVWNSIALHTTPGVPCHMHPVVALVTRGVEMDVLGMNYEKFSNEERETVVSAFPRTPNFKEDIINAFYDGIKNKPDTTFGNVKADVIADKEAQFRRGNFCDVIRSSPWRN